MPGGQGRYVGRAGKKKRAHTPAQVVVWVAAMPVALAFLLLLGRQSLPLGFLVFLVVVAFAWWEWKRS